MTGSVPDIRRGAGVPIAVGLVGAFLLVVRALGLDVQAVVLTTGALSVVWIWLAVKATVATPGIWAGCSPTDHGILSRSASTTSRRSDRAPPRQR